MEQYSINNIAGVDFENAERKNRCITQTAQPFLIFSNEDVVSGEEICGMLSEYCYMEQTRLLVFCEHAPETSDWYGILMDPELTVYALVVCRDLFAEVGAFNFRLTDETNREFLCRAAQVCEPLFLECSQVEWRRNISAEMFRTNAYLLVRYLQPLQETGEIGRALERYTLCAASAGYKEVFEHQMSQMLSEDRS